MPGGFHPPLDVILSWRPDYINPERRGAGLLVLAGFLLCLVYVVVLLRIYVRGIQTRAFGLDDTLVAVNLLFITGLTICICLVHAVYGGDKHVWDVPFETLLGLRKVTIGTIQLFTTANTLTKISILLFYRRLTGNTLSRAYRWMLNGAIASVIGYFVAFTVTLFTGCTPFSSFWKQIDPFLMEDWRCVDEAKAIIAGSIVSMIQDFMCCFMPVVLFRKLQISRRKKLGLLAVFGIGFSVCISGVLRCIFVHRLYYGTYDATWDQARISATTIIEVDVAVICASLPALSHLSRKFVTSNVDVVSRLRSVLTGRTNHSEFKKTGSNSNIGVEECLENGPDRYREHESGIHVVESFSIDEYHLPERSGLVHQKQLAMTWLDTSSQDALHKVSEV